MVGQQACRMNPRGHLGQHELHTLELVDALSELPTLARILRGKLEGSLGDPEGVGGDADSTGTSTSSRISSRVSEAFQPSFRSFWPEVKPAIGSRSSLWPKPSSVATSRSQVSFERMKALIP